jgi:hypothetical protein
MGRKPGRGKMRCYDVRGCNVGGRERAATTKMNAATPEERSATRSGYHWGRRDAKQKNRCDANRKVSHNANCDAGTNQERACDVQHQAALILARCHRMPVIIWYLYCLGLGPVFS